MDLFKPRAAGAPRRPTDDKREHGQVVNTPRFAQFGGLKNPATVGKTGMRVEKPGDGRKVI